MIEISGEAIEALVKSKNAEVVWGPSGGDIIFIPRGFREVLPKKRPCRNFKARIGGHNVFITIGEFPDGRPAEIFIDIAKEGAALRSFVSLCARLISKGLQYGIPINELCDTLIGMSFDPSGLDESPDDAIEDASSIPDFVGQLLRKLYVRQ